MNYRELQYARVADLMVNNADIFNGDTGYGMYFGKERPFILKNSCNNLYCEILEDSQDYFNENGIKWWGGRITNHTLSSQIACLNHLFLLKKDRQAILAIAQNIDSEIVDVLPIMTDTHPEYVQFEAVSDTDHLNEKCSTRGSNCTSVDVLIYGVRQDGLKVIFPIEWKYTEAYANDNKANGDKGKERKRRYTGLIDSSEQLCSTDTAVYYYEPFYQLMRQTLWAEQMIKNKDTERVKADDYIHVHVIPSDNYNLLKKNYLCSGKNMEDTWRTCIKDQSKYMIITPENLLKPIAGYARYSRLLEYLNIRYWKK